MSPSNSCQITVRVTPRASRESVETVDDVIKVWVMAAPTDGQANDAVIKVVAKRLGTTPSRISIIRGHTSREKVLYIEGLTESDVQTTLG
jgi:uncharacterized protein